MSTTTEIDDPHSRPHRRKPSFRLVCEVIAAIAGVATIVYVAVQLL
jgi:hypothetical protein